MISKSPAPWYFKKELKELGVEFNNNITYSEATLLIDKSKKLTEKQKEEVKKFCILGINLDCDKMTQYEYKLLIENDKNLCKSLNIKQ